MVKIGLIGYGYWGPNLLRNFRSLPNAEVTVVIAKDEKRRKLIHAIDPAIKTADSADIVFNDETVDAIVIATPISTHHSLAKQALESGKHVLVEKPLCTSTREADELLDLAKEKNKVLMVDHTFLYTAAVQKIKALVDSGQIGKLQYFDSTRINLGLFNPKHSVLWDLMPHDLSILNYITSNKKAVGISATGVSHTELGIENIGYMTLHYEDDLVAHISSSWVSPVKVRQTLIGGTEKMIIYDDVEPTEKIKIYDSGYSVNSVDDEHNYLIDYRVGDIHIPKLDQKEALKGMAEDFISAVLTGSTPISNNKLAYQVVSQIEAAEASIKGKGAFTKLKHESDQYSEPNTANQ